MTLAAVAMVELATVMVGAIQVWIRRAVLNQAASILAASSRFWVAGLLVIQAVALGLQLHRHPPYGTNLWINPTNGVKLKK